MKLLSVIVPVYKVEDYLHQCIDSILNQTYKNLEVILVDDGSPDESGAICDEYAQLDSRVKVLHQENAGLSAARNRGIEVCHGDYVAFVDSDDYIDVHMYKELIDFLEEENLDIVVCSGYRDKDGIIKGGSYSYEKEIFEKDRFMPAALTTRFTPAWDKVYKRKVIGDVRYPEGRKFEDSATTYLIFNNANRVGSYDKPFYYYRVNMNSITQTSFDAKSRWDYVEGYIERLGFARRKYPQLVNDCVSLLVKSVLSCLTAVYARSQENEMYYYKCRDIIETYKNHPGVTLYLNSKYRLYLACFDQFEWVLRLGAKLSYYSKLVKKIIK